MKNLATTEGIEAAGIDGLIGLLYDAATDAEKWKIVLAELARHFDSIGAQYMHYDLKDDRFSCTLYHGMDHLSPEWYRRYEELAVEDPRYLSVKRLLGDRPAAATLTCRMLVSEEELHASRFYKEALAPAGIEYSASIHIANESLLTVLGLIRGPSQRPYSDVDIAQLQQLIPHLQRATRIQKQLAQIDFAARSSLDAVDKFPTGVLIVDANLAVHMVNRAAGLLVDLDDGIAVRGRSIVIENQERQSEVGAAVRDAIVSARGGRIRPGRSFAIARRGGGDAFTLHVSTLWGNRLRFGLAPLAEPLAVMFLTDPSQPLRPSVEALRQFFTLTEAEARLAALLASGLSLNTCARELGRSVATCRTHLKAIFGKTNVSRQGDLVRLILSTPAWIDPA